MSSGATKIRRSLSIYFWNNNREKNYIEVN
ncbi:hypothetical protein Xind_01011 [Xenorhabdus indica]|nr:hypothetical protein [Xenorhabdus indica]